MIERNECWLCGNVFESWDRAANCCQMGVAVNANMPDGVKR